MATGKTPSEETKYRDDTYDYMFSVLVNDKYKHLLGHMPITTQPKAGEATEGKLSPTPAPTTTKSVDVKPPVVTSTHATVSTATPTIVSTSASAKVATSTLTPVATSTPGTASVSTTGTLVTHSGVSPVLTSTPGGEPPAFESYLKGFTMPPLGPDIKYKTPAGAKKEQTGLKLPETPLVDLGHKYSLDFDTPKFPSPTKRKPVVQNTAPNANVNTGSVDASLIDLAKVPIPKLPQFSGTDAKGDTSYQVWKYEVTCLLKEKIYPDAHILQAIRRSLKGEARESLLSAGETASSEDVLKKLNGIYGTVASNESILQQFYLEKQREDENVAQYSIRLENMLQQIKDYVPEQLKNEMLRSKLWSGLRDPQLKNASRFKYDLEPDFNQLRIAIRKIEQDMLNTATVQTTSLQQQPVVKGSDSALEEILKRLRAMEGKMEGWEKTLEKKIENKLKEKLDEKSNIEDSEKGARGRGNNRGRGNYRGRYRGGRSRGNRGSLNEQGSTS